MFVKQNHDRFRQDIRRIRKWFFTRDGRKLYSRLMLPTDTELLIDLFSRLSPETKRRRFHYPVDLVEPDLLLDAARHLADVDNRTRGGAVVALEESPEGQRIVGVARLMRDENAPDSPDVEAAIVVRDDYHGQGVASELLRRMVLLARHMQATTIVAEIEADNYPAIKLFRELDLPTETTTSHGETTMRIAVPR